MKIIKSLKTVPPGVAVEVTHLQLTPRERAAIYKAREILFAAEELIEEADLELIGDNSLGNAVSWIDIVRGEITLDGLEVYDGLSRPSTVAQGK